MNRKTTYPTFGANCIGCGVNRRCQSRFYGHTIVVYLLHLKNALPQSGIGIMKRFFISLTMAVMLASCMAHTSETTYDLQPFPSEGTVILLHGFGRSNTAMWLLARRLECAGFVVKQVGYDSLRNSPERILQDISRKINACCAGLEQPVHFVGHSLGGLLIRAYLEGMDDFIVIETSHSMMRYNKDVANQAIEYLKHGHFTK